VVEGLLTGMDRIGRMVKPKKATTLQHNINNVILEDLIGNPDFKAWIPDRIIRG
jgi:hypothetical protein